MTSKRFTSIRGKLVGAASLAVAVFIATYVFCVFVLGHDHGVLRATLLIWGVLSIVFAVVESGKRHDKRLSQRALAQESGLWEVRMNGARLGAMRDSDLAVLQQAIFRDWRHAVEQLGNVGLVMATLAERLILSFPVVIFWLFLCLSLYEPTAIADFLQRLLQANPQTIEVAAGQVVVFGVVFTLPVLAVMLSLGERFKFRNCYAAALNRRVRDYFETSFAGDITLCNLSENQAQSSNTSGSNQ